MQCIVDHALSLPFSSLHRNLSIRCDWDFGTSKINRELCVLVELFILIEFEAMSEPFLIFFFFLLRNLLLFHVSYHPSRSPHCGTNFKNFKSNRGVCWQVRPEHLLKNSYRFLGWAYNPCFQLSRPDQAVGFCFLQLFPLAQWLSPI